MKLNFALKACLTAGISMLSVIPASIAHAGGVPTYIIQHRGVPDIAVFTDVKQSYAIGCPALRSLWSRVPVQTAATSDVFDRIVSANPVVANIPCNGSVDPYVTTPSGLGALVITHRDGKRYRHYINSGDFIRAVGGGNSISISGDEFARRFPNRGTDFRVFRVSQ